MAHNPARPLSPHLTVWKWGPHMLVSILHRATGTAMATAGVLIFTWWLTAAATSAGAYEIFYHWIVAPDPLSAHEGAQQAVHILAIITGIVLSWAFFQHMASGIRHWFMDVGAAFELGRNKRAARATFLWSIPATILYWVIILGVKG